MRPIITTTAGSRKAAAKGMGPLPGTGVAGSIRCAMIIGAKPSPFVPLYRRTL